MTFASIALNGLAFSDPGTLISLIALGACALLGMARCSCGCEDGDHEHAGGDYAELESQIAALAQVANRTPDQERELANLYFRHANLKQEYDELEDAILSFDRGIEAVNRIVDQTGPDDTLRRMLGHAYLGRAVAKNDFDEPQGALLDYEKAIEAIKPLADRHDGDAMYDIAGIQLNRGTIFHELGDFDKANEELDASFLAFRALEKISDLGDTRYYMAKVSVAMGSLYRDMDEPIEKIIDVYNRAMRLLVELIDIGQMEHEHELAVVLLDKCTARFDAYMEQEFADETERAQLFDDVLLDVSRGIEILKRLAIEGNPNASYDLFCSLVTQGTMMLELGRNDEAIAVFDELLDSFSELARVDDPMIRHQYAGIEDNRGAALYNLQRHEDALSAFQNAVQIRETLMEDVEEWDPEDVAEFAMGLGSAYLNRANVYGILNEKDKATADCQAAIELIEPLAKEYGEEFQEVLEQIRQVRKALGES